MSKKIWITTGLLAATAVGATVMVAHAERGRDGDGWRGHGDRYESPDHGMRGHHRGRDHRGGWGRGKRDVTKDEFDAETRSKFAAWDANSDGVVDRTEVEVAMAQRAEGREGRRGRHGRRDGRHWQRMLNRFDADSDGKVTKAEIETYVTERFTRMDLDTDGKITDADLPPMMRGMNILSGGEPGDMAGFGMGHYHGKHHGRGSHRGGHRMLRHLIGADTDKDGAVTLQELQDRAAKRFARFDRNGDGSIDQADRDALRKEMTDYRVLRFMHRHGAQDGKLTLEQYTKTRNERFAKRDVDGDDTIERGEGRGGWRSGPDSDASGDRDGDSSSTPNRGDQ